MSEKIPHWLTKQAELSPGQVAMELENGETLTFSQLAEQSQQYARRLITLGVVENDHVAIFSTNCKEMIIAIHALSYVGACPVLLNTRLTAEEMQYQIDDANVSLLLVAETCLTSITPLRVKEKMTFSEVSHLVEANSPLKTELDLDQAFTIIYTSGTTGFPKGVVHTYGNHWWNAIGSALNLGLSTTDKWLAVLPFFHVGGLSIFIRSVIYGMPVFLMEKFNEQRVNDAIFNKGVTIASVVTVMLQRLLRNLGKNKYPDYFRCMLLGGGPVPKPLLEKAKAQQIPVFQSYGMTETSSQIVTLRPQDALEKLGSAGKALFPAQIRINANIGEVGEIEVKGPMVSKEYWHQAEANEKSFKNGWLQTGDLGYLDEEGFLYVVDRRHDLIISGGENIYPSEIESVISQLEAVREVGVTGIHDHKWGEVPVAFIVKEKSALLLSEADIFTFLSKKIANYKIPKAIYFVDSLPRNASNKLMRSKLKEWAQTKNRH